MTGGELAPVFTVDPRQWCRGRGAGRGRGCMSFFSHPQCILFTWTPPNIQRCCISGDADEPQQPEYLKCGARTCRVMAGKVSTQGCFRLLQEASCQRHWHQEKLDVRQKLFCWQQGLLEQAWRPDFALPVQQDIVSCQWVAAPWLQTPTE